MPGRTLTWLFEQIHSHLVYLRKEKQRGILTKPICGTGGNYSNTDQWRNLHLSAFEGTLGSGLCQQQRVVRRA